MPRSPTRDRTLSEDVIVRAALEIIRRTGVAALTMRDLADLLGVSPMAAYHYVDGKDDLIRLVGNHVWAMVTVPGAEAGPWHERLRASMLAEREAIRDYRGLYDAVLYLDVEHKRDLEDAQFDLLLEAGYSAAAALAAFRLLMSWVAGYSSIETAMRDPKMRRPPSHWGKAKRVAIERQDAASLQNDDYFVFGLDAVIAGMRATVDD